MFINNEQCFKPIKLWVIVVFIIVLIILALYAINNVSDCDHDELMVSVAKSDVKMIYNAVEHYKLRVQSYPDIEEYLETLEELMTGPAGWENKWIPLLQGRSVPKDPWGNDYEFVNDEEYGITIICYGKDNAEGGTGFGKDIMYPEEGDGYE